MPVNIVPQLNMFICHIKKGKKGRKTDRYIADIKKGRQERNTDRQTERKKEGEKCPPPLPKV